MHFKLLKKQIQLLYNRNNLKVCRYTVQVKYFKRSLAFSPLCYIFSFRVNITSKCQNFYHTYFILMKQR